MKRTKLLLLIATLLTVATLFSSCGTVSSVNKFLNEDYDPTEDVYNDASSISELTGYVVTEHSNSDFVVLMSGEAPAVSYKIFSLTSQTVVATLTNSLVDTVLTVYTFELDDDCPVILVTKTQTKQEESTGDTAEDITSDVIGGIVSGDIQEGVEDAAAEILDIEYTLYDAEGKVKSTEYKPVAPFRVTYDTLVFDYKAYTIGTDGVLTEKVDIPEYVAIEGIDAWNDDYYYAIDSNSVSVFDHAFNAVSVWVAPSYVYNTINAFVLNNGDILVQYTYEIDEDQKKYDITICEDERTEKHKLVSLIVDAKNGKAKEVALDYYVMNVMSNYSINAYYNFIDEVSPYNDKFENAAIIAPIVNKNIDHSMASLDLVFMNNNGKAQDSLKLVDNQMASFIHKIGADRYIASTLTGMAVIDAKGNLIKAMNNDLDLVGIYFVGERAIYSLDLEVIYDLAENNAEVIGTVANTIFVKVKTDNGYSIISFCNGEQDTLYTYTKDVAPTSTFNIVEDIGYVIVDVASKDHKYYNAEGELILTTPYNLTVISTADNGTVLLSGIHEGKSIYHVFSIETDAE